jgi:hypothetical protein
VRMGVEDEYLGVVALSVIQALGTVLGPGVAAIGDEALHALGGVNDVVVLTEVVHVAVDLGGDVVDAVIDEEDDCDGVRCGHTYIKDRCGLACQGGASVRWMIWLAGLAEVLVLVLFVIVVEHFSDWRSERLSFAGRMGAMTVPVAQNVDFNNIWRERGSVSGLGRVVPGRLHVVVPMKLFSLPPELTQDVLLVCNDDEPMFSVWGTVTKIWPDDMVDVQVYMTGRGNATDS